MYNMTRRLTLGLILIGCTTYFTGCGPISAHNSIARAHIAIEASKGARASELAVFEYNSALLYLDKAKREEGLSSFQEAVNFAERAQSFAHKARARALQKSRARPLTPAERRRLQTRQQAAPTAPTAPSKSVTPVTTPAPASTNAPAPAPAAPSLMPSPAPR